jgi:chromosome segregation ATPase
MCKKIGIAVVAVLVGLFVVKKTEVGSLLKGCWRDAKTWTRNQIPLEKQIADLKADLASLDKSDARHYDAVAERIVEVDNLRKEVAKMRLSLEEQERGIKARNDDLKSNRDTFVYSGENLSREKFEKRLRSDFEFFTRAQAALDAKQKQLEARDEGLSKAREQLRELKTVRKEMETELARLETELQNLNLAKLRSNVQLDDSDYARIREGMNRVRDRINVQVESLKLQGEYEPRTEVKEKPADKNLTQDIDTYFSTKNGK